MEVTVFTPQTLEGWVGVLLPILGLICAAAWWMSSLYSEVKGIRVFLEKQGERLELHDVRLNGVEHRLTHIEAKIGDD